MHQLLASLVKRLTKLESLGLVFDIHNNASNLKALLELRKTYAWYRYRYLNEDHSISGRCFPQLSNGEIDNGEFRIECNIPNQYQIYATFTNNSFV